MTAGQGPQGDPAGQAGAPDQPDQQGWGAPQGSPPQGWGPPPGQSPYGQSPYGQPPYGQPPYGQPPHGPAAQGQPHYPGYAPAPSAPTGYGAPTPVERPLTVRAGIGAFVGSIVLSLVGQVITLANWDTVISGALIDAETDLGQLSEAEGEAAADLVSGLAESLGTAGFIIGLLFTGLFALFVWFAWKGHNWARIVLWVLTGLGLLSGLAALGIGGTPLPVLNWLSGFEILFDIAAVVLLALAPSNEWYRYRGWLRATGQRG